MATPRFLYLIAAHNEAPILPALVARLHGFVQRYPGSCVYLLDNGSRDATWPVMQDLARRHPGWVVACHDDGKGMGVAYRRGLTEIVGRPFTPPLSSDDWLVLTAADLPFGFTDVESLLVLDEGERRRLGLVVGSKAHPRSRAPRGLKRRLGTFVFALARRLILGLKTRDTQGTLLIRADLAPQFLPLAADDFFFAVEIVDRAERSTGVREVPVTLEAEQRPSRVQLLADGWRMIRQMQRYRRRRAGDSGRRAAARRRGGGAAG